MELWTERQATQHLQRMHLGRDAARSALKAGVAGAPIIVRNSLLYRADAVRAAFDRADEPCQVRVRSERPVFVARVGPRSPDSESSWRSWRGADVLAPVAEQRDAARGWWHLGDRMYALVRGVGEVKGMPFVVTCGGLVVLGAEITGIDEALVDEGVCTSRSRRAASRQGRRYTRLASAFTLTDPGPWFEGQYGRRFSTGAGGPFRVLHAGPRARPSMAP